MTKIRLPGKFARFAAGVMAFILMLTLTLTCLTWQVNRVATDRALHESIAADGRITTMQLERIRQRVEELAGEYHFQAETAMQFITADTLAEHSRQAIAWWMGLMGEEPETEAPMWDTGDMEQAIREDTLFQENTPANMRRTTARDLIAYEIGLAVDKAVLPVRADILSLVMPKALEMVDVPVYMQYLAMVPMLCAGACAVLALLILLVTLRRVSKAARCIGIALVAAALCIVTVGVTAYLLDVTGMVGTISTLLAAQVSLLTKQVALQSALFAAGCLVIGLCLIGLHQKDMRRLYRIRRSVEA